MTVPLLGDMAAKLARLVYRMLRYGDAIHRSRRNVLREQHRKLQITLSKRKAANLGFQVIEARAA